MTRWVPEGFKVAGVHCGLKSKPEKPDLVLIVAERDAVAVGVYTTNVVCAAPVVLDRSRTPMDNCRVIIANAGCANACTGDEGDRNALTMTRWAAEAVGASEGQALVLSTGLIGEQLKMDRIRKGVDAAREILGDDEKSLSLAARGILTTDLVQKIARRSFVIDGETIDIVGIAKGSGMIGPNMATMLSVIMTNAKLAPNDAQAMLRRVNDATFNHITVDGHVSTNDTALLIASGAGSKPGHDKKALATFERGLEEVCVELARAIVDDGEGATHLVTIDIDGCKTVEDAGKIAQTVANSPLVKTAIAGNDPNWGRIVSAAGYAGVAFDPKGVSLHLNGTLLYKNGQPVKFDGDAVSESIKASRETHVLLKFTDGDASTRFWTCDFTHEYVTINAEYHT